MTHQMEKYEDLGMLLTIPMGKLSFSREAVGAVDVPQELVNVTLPFHRLPYRCSCASLGGAHCVITLPDISPELTERIAASPELRHYFPHGVNIELVNVLDRSNIRVIIHETGTTVRSLSGLNCYSAAAGTLYRMGMVNHQVNVWTIDGMLQVEIDHDLRVSVARPYGFRCRNLYV